MSKTEFSRELVDRCWDACRGKGHPLDIIEITLRESGHAELVAALKRARLYVASSNLISAAKALPEIDAALINAGAL